MDIVGGGGPKASGKSEQVVDAVDFRTAMASVPGPVTVITSFDGERPHGTTVSAFCSLSAEPPLVLVALDQNSDLLRYLHVHGAYGVNLLAAGQEEVAKVCATKGAGKFDRIEWSADAQLPRIAGCAAWFACRVHALTQAGDHLIVSGLVSRAETSGLPPLVYHQRRMIRMDSLS